MPSRITQGSPRGLYGVLRRAAEDPATRNYPRNLAGVTCARQHILVECQNVLSRIAHNKVTPSRGRRNIVKRKRNMVAKRQVALGSPLNESFDLEFREYRDIQRKRMFFGRSYEYSQDVSSKGERKPVDVR
ncbi:hypothetical protein HZH68_001497 [Vespula germanica]|uniref:Uncharacterized protein n=1 Tax=Vespula germanica TaxID=30212 RepID=A0A834NVR2_VESGE|nr:hypothetical protein HZH68_001497 [Vespula germanica]